MKAIRYHVRLEEPMLTTALGGDPNSACALEYLPGSVLRGAIIARYARRSGTIDPADALQRRLFFDGSTRYLNAYPVDRRQRRGLPVPGSWQHKKREDVPLYDFAVDKPHDYRAFQWQGVSDPFCVPDEDEEEVTFLRPSRRLAVHNQRERTRGRATRDAGAVFRYEALAPAQTFSGVVLCNEDGDAKTLEALLDGGEAYLGGSRTAGYGRVRFDAIAITDGAAWRETANGSLEEALEDGGKLILTLLSDALLRDPDTGQYCIDTEVFTNSLIEKTGLPFTKPEVWLRTRAVGGFNQTWGLPLPQTIALAKGSVLVYAPPPCDATELQNAMKALERDGIGERRVEGFGRLAVNWQSVEEWLERAQASSTPNNPTLPAHSSSEKIARIMAKRLLADRLDERLVDKSRDITVHRPPPRSQLSRLRQIIRDELARDVPDPERLIQFLESVKERKRACSHFQNARVGSQSLMDWLTNTLQRGDETSWAQLMGVQNTDLPALGGVTAEISDALRRRYLLRYIDSVLARTQKSAE